MNFIKNFFRKIKVANATTRRLTNIEMAINKLKESYDDVILVADYDGASIEANYQLEEINDVDYFESSILPCKNDDLDEFSVNNNIYKNIRTLETTKFFAGLFSKNNLYFLTRTDANVKEFKETAILKEFDVYRDHIIHVKKSDYKVTELELLYEEKTKNGEKVLILLLEDELSMCLKAEEALNSKTVKKVKAIPISHLVA